MQAHLPPVIIIGAGDHALVLIEALQSVGRRVLSITESSNTRLGKRISGVLIEGEDKLIYEHDPRSIELVNAIGSIDVPSARRTVYIKFASRGYRFATVVHLSLIHI